MVVEGGDYSDKPKCIDMKKNEAQIERIQINLVVGCSDSRRVRFLDSIIEEELVRAYALRGIMAMIETMSVAGTYMTPDNISEVKGRLHRIMHSSMDHADGRLDLIVQLLTHGKVGLAPFVTVGKTTYSEEEITVDETSRTHCGMAHAAEAWKELMKLIFDNANTDHKLATEYYDKATGKTVNTVDEPIDNEGRLQKLLRNVYFYTGEHVRGFITNIDKLVKHITDQKGNLKAAIRMDPELGDLPVIINAGIEDFETGGVIRVDRNDHAYFILDDKARIKEIALTYLPEDDPERIWCASKQADVVKAGIICTSDINNPRTALAKSLGVGAGSIFGIINDKVANYWSAFGPSAVVAFYYSVAHLGVGGYHIIGVNEKQTNKIMKKINEDPLIQFVIRLFGVKIHAYPESELREKIRKTLADHEEITRYKEVVRRVMQNYTPPAQSVLHKPHVNTITDFRLKRIR